MGSDILCGPPHFLQTCLCGQGSEAHGFPALHLKQMDSPSGVLSISFPLPLPFGELSPTPPFIRALGFLMTCPLPAAAAFAAFSCSFLAF